MTTDPTLSPEQLRTLEESRERAKGSLAAARVAAFNGWTMGVFAGITVLSGLIGGVSPLLLALGAGMGVVSRNEFRGRALLRGFDPEGPTLLTRNQLGFMALVVAYCGWSLVRALTSPDPQWVVLQELAGLQEGYIQGLVTTGYLAAILLTVLFVGLNARYYHRRSAMLDQYLAVTPDWVVALHRSASVD